jgi:hypothetical protein
MGDNLRNHGKQISVSLRADEDGYFGRECPEKECVGYFKVTFGTGIKGAARGHCPNCGQSRERDAQLIPTVGSCADCPKRTGHNNRMLLSA